MIVNGEGDYLIKSEHCERHKRLWKLMAEEGENELAEYHWQQWQAYQGALSEWIGKYGAPRW